MSSSRGELTELLRRRLLAGLRDGTLASGARLTSTRELARELRVDPRVALAAYGELAREGMVEMRPRSGIYLAARADSDGAPMPSAAWLVELLGDGVERDVAVPDLARWLQRAVETLRLRALVVAATADQTVGICAELSGIYGLHAECVMAAGSSSEVALSRGPSSGGPSAEIASPEGASQAGRSSGTAETAWLERLLATGSRLPSSLTRADLVVTTPGSATLARPLAERLGVPLVLADVRPDLLGAQWRTLLLQPVYVVVADERFGQMVRAFVHGAAGAHQLTVLVAGRDDVAGIPADAPVYVTRAAQERLAGRSLPGRRIPPARIFTAEASRAILRWMVATNLSADEAQRTAAAAITPPPDAAVRGSRAGAT